MGNVARQRIMPKPSGVVTVHNMRAVIAKDVRNARLSGRTLKDMGATAGLNPTTISKIASEDTKYPRFSSIVAIMHTLGYRIVAERA